MQTGKTMRLYHKMLEEEGTSGAYCRQVLEKEQRIESPQFPIADETTQVDVPVVSLAGTTTQFHLPAIAIADTPTRPRLEALPKIIIKSQQFFNRLRKKQPTIQREQDGLTLRVHRSSLPTEALIRQEVTRFWQDARCLPGVIFLPLKRYQETTENGYIINGNYIPYEVGAGREDIVLKQRYWYPQ